MALGVKVTMVNSTKSVGKTLQGFPRVPTTVPKHHVKSWALMLALRVTLLSARGVSV